MGAGGGGLWVDHSFNLLLCEQDRSPLLLLRHQPSHYDACEAQL